MEQTSVECAVNDESVQVLRENSSPSKNIAFSVISVGKTKATYIICRKESKGNRVTRDFRYIIGCK